MEAVERGSTWADETVLLLIRIWTEEEIKLQLSLVSK